MSQAWTWMSLPCKANSKWTHTEQTYKWAYLKLTTRRNQAAAIKRNIITNNNLKWCILLCSSNLRWWWFLPLWQLLIICLLSSLIQLLAIVTDATSRSQPKWRRKTPINNGWHAFYFAFSLFHTASSHSACPAATDTSTSVPIATKLSEWVTLDEENYQYYSLFLNNFIFN